MPEAGMRVGFIPVRADMVAASARLRVHLPIRFLREQGRDCEVFAPGRDYDLVVFSKVYGEREIELATRLRDARRGTCLDLCDNHFWVHDGAPALVERAERLRRMVAIVDHVSVSSETLKEVVATECPGKPCTVVDDAVDPMPTPLRTRLGSWLGRHRIPRGKELRVVWFGHQGEKSPPFGLVDLEPLLPRLDAVHAQVPLALTVITGSAQRVRELNTPPRPYPVKFKRWDRATFRTLFEQHDVCVLPITENPFTRCKTANRVILSLLLGVPVVADMIPSYREFEPFLHPGRFEEHLVALARSPQEAQRRTSAGRAEVLRTRTPERVVSQWSELIRQVADGRSGAHPPAPAASPRHA